MSRSMAEPPPVVLRESGHAPAEVGRPDELHIYDSNGDNSVTDSEQMLMEANRGKTLSAATTEYLTTSNQCVIDLKYGGENYSDTSSDYSSEEYEANEKSMEHSPKSNCSCKKCCSICLGNDLNVYCTKHAHTFFKNAPRNVFFHSPTPVALLDLFCQRFEESHNFDIDIIIIYVNSVIDQLKRISNGDYLTSTAKERWIAVDSQMTSRNIEDKEAELENEFCSFPPSSEDAFETQVDIRPLFENFDKTVTKEVPRMLTDSEEISINNMDVKMKPVEDSSATVSKDSKFNITIQIQPSLTGRLFRNFEALAQLEGSKITFTDGSSTDSLPMLTNMDASLDFHPLKELKSHHSMAGAGISIVKIVEIIDITSGTNFYMNEERNKFDDLRTVPYDTVSHNSSNTTVSLLDVLDKLSQATVNSEHPSPFNPTSADDLKATMQNLNIQSCLEEVSNEEGSLNNEEVPTKQKTKSCKSTYENQRHAVDDKRRRRLLEVQENREKRKLRMMHEKHSTKYGRNVKSHIAASNSVTRLSISNKSFYNSIFGHSSHIVNGRGQKVKINRKLQKQKEMEDFAKHIKETAIFIHTRQKSKEKVLSNVNAVESSEKEHRLKDLIDWKRQFDECKNNVLKRVDSLISTESSNSYDMRGLTLSFGNEKSEDKLYDNNDEIQEPHNSLHNTYSMHHLKTSKNRAWKNKFINNISSTKISTDSKMLDPIEETDRTTEKKHPSRFTMECRESIDKIYDLIRKIGTTDNLTSKMTKTKFTTSNTNKPISSIFRTHGLTTQDSESGTSMKHYSSTSFVSSSSTEKLNTTNTQRTFSNLPKPTEAPKVIITSKSPTKEKKPESELSPKHQKKINQAILTKSSPSKSRLITPRVMTKVLQEVNILPKTKQRTMQETRQLKFISLNNRENPNRSSRLDRHIRQREDERVLFRVHQGIKGKEASKFLESTEKHGMQKKRTRELTDEEKESRGEAVRGPVTSRLDALAQPRKAYVKAHSEQFSNKYGRTIMADRLQRLVHPLPPPTPASIINSNLRRSFPNALKTMNYTKAAVTDKYNHERRSNSSPDSRTTSSQITEGLLLKKRLKDVISTPKESMNTEHHWDTNSSTKYEYARNTVPLVPKNSEQDNFEREPSSELLITQDLIDILNPDQYNYINSEIAEHGDKENSAVDNDVVVFEKIENSLPRTENVVAKIKNGRVSIDSEDLVDFDVLNLSNEHKYEQPHNMCICARSLPHNVGSLTTLEKVSHNNAGSLLHNDGNLTTLEKISTSTVIENCTLSEPKSTQAFEHHFKDSTSSLTKISSRNIFILQAGNLSTKFTIKSTSVLKLLRSDICKVKSCTNLSDIKNFINLSNILSVWDVAMIPSLPRQISTVGYAFLEPHKPCIKYESKIYHFANTINYNIVHKPTEYNVCTILEQANIHQVPNSKEPIVPLIVALIVPNGYAPLVPNFKEFIVSSGNENIVINSNEHVVPNGNALIVPNVYEPILSNGNEIIEPNDKERVVPNDNVSIVPNGSELIMLNGSELIVPNGKEPFEPNSNAPIVLNGYEPIVSNVNENIVPNDKERIVPNGNALIVPNGSELIVPIGKEPIVPNGYKHIVLNDKKNVMLIGMDQVGPISKEPIVSNSMEPIVPNSKEPVVSNSKEQNYKENIVSNCKDQIPRNCPIDEHTDKRSFGTDPIPNNKHNDYIGATGKLDCTNSLDVLFSLLNEIHSISTGKMQVAGMHGFQYIENVKPIHFVTIYYIKTTTESATFSFSENTLDPISALEMCVDVPVKKSWCTDEDARKESFELMNVYKKLNAVEPQNKLNIVKKESAIDFRTNMKLKRGILVSTYALLILAVFAAMSYPDILLLQS